MQEKFSNIHIQDRVVYIQYTYAENMKKDNNYKT